MYQIEDLCEDMATLMDDDDDGDDEEYMLKGNLEMKGAYNIGDVEMTFLQVWCLFGMPEGIMKKRYYEYRIDGPRSNFIIYSVGERFLKITRWHIVSETLCERTNKAFLDHLQRGLDCYESYYRCIENGVYESEDTQVDKAIKDIMSTLEENMSKLKRM
jgi:hypothetical protein